MWQKSKPYWLLAPALSIVIILFLDALWEGLLGSLGIFPAVEAGSPSLTSYWELFHSQDFWDALMFSLRVAAISTLSAGGIGIALAAGLVWIEQKKGIHAGYKWYRLMQWPLSVPHLVGAYTMVLFLAQSGWLARWAYTLGWIDRTDQFPVLVNDPFGWGIIVTYTWKETPFITLMLYPVLRRIQQKWWDVARMHGAGTREFIQEVVLPLLRPAWLAASFIVFAFTLSAFEVPYLLGVTYPQALPVFSYELYTNGDFSDRPEALAANVILALITFVLGGFGYGLIRGFNGKEGGKW